MPAAFSPRTAQNWTDPGEDSRRDSTHGEFIPGLRSGAPSLVLTAPVLVCNARYSVGFEADEAIFARPVRSAEQLSSRLVGRAPVMNLDRPSAYERTPT